MDKNKAQDIYNTLLGVQCENFSVSRVEDLFAEGSDCDRAYYEMLGAYARLCERLGVTDEDRDVEIVINSLMTIQRKVSMKMFEYGMKFAVEKEP